MSDKQTQKGVLDSFIFTPAQRAEYYRLLQLGVPDVQARALAQALTKSAKLSGPTVDELPQPCHDENHFLEALIAKSSHKSASRRAPDNGQLAMRSLAKSGYHARFVAEAKTALGHHLFNDIHNKARSSAGGAASGVSRRAARDADTQSNVEWVKFLRKELSLAEAAVAKSSPTASEVHVDRPLSEDKRKLSLRVPKLARGVKQVKEVAEPEPLGETKPIKKDGGSHTPPDGVRSACKRGLELAPEYGGKGLTEGAKSRARSMAGGKAVTEAQLRRMANFFSRHQSDRTATWAQDKTPGYVAWQLWGGDAGKSWAESKLKGVDKAERVLSLTNTGDESDTLPQGPMTPKLNAQRLVAGMDYHMGNGTEDPTEARALASRMLSRDMGMYDNLFQNDPQVANLPGLDIDIGSGAKRQPGYLGLDLYAYDYGTAIFDYMELPLPFEDGEVRELRMSNVPVDVDSTGWALAFLKEVQRVLTYGGIFVFDAQSDAFSRVDLSQVPGLRVIDNTPSTLPLEEEPSRTQLTFERVRARLPWVYGADPKWLARDEQNLQELMLNEAMGVPTHTFAGQAMANLLTKSNSQEFEALVVKSEAPQRIITSVVYAPDELDTDGEWMNAQDIENAAHMFLQQGGFIGSEHEGKPIGADVVESYIAPCDMTFDGPYGEQAVPKGAWIMTVKFSSEKEWQKLLSGEYTGFSVGGYASA